MKTKLVLALSAAALLAVVSPGAFAEEPSPTPSPESPAASPPSSLRLFSDKRRESAATPIPAASAAPTQPFTPPNVEFHHWRQGEPAVKLIRWEEGFCALTRVTGHFQGGGEQVRVYVADDGYWYLGGYSRQSDVAAECIVVRLPIAPVPAANAVNILAASYSFGSEFADVTERVKELLRDGNTFQANPTDLQVDPHPYWNKCLVIFCEVRGKRAILSVGEGERVSRELLLEKAVNLKP